MPKSLSASSFPLRRYTLLLLFCLSEIALAAVPEYVTSSACGACHAQIASAWSNSHHSWAWRPPTAENILGDFDNAVLEHHGFHYRFLNKGGVPSVVADGPGGEEHSYPVHSVVGVEPLQQLLVEHHGGRLQVLDVAWDRERERWYHLYPDQPLSANQGMHWSRSYKNWNARCAVCHATGYEKGYDAGSDRYLSRQAEIGVGCEACHGPGEAHLAWARDPDRFDRQRWEGIDATGLIVDLSSADPRIEIEQCAGCHSLREPLTPDSPIAGTPFADSHRLLLLRDPLYFADGQIKEEVYVYGSFLQSRMYAAGVRCSHCHDPHSAELRAEGDAICTQCHSPAGNLAFPSAPRGAFDTAEHHAHAAESEAAQCVSCHMPSRTYMGIDERRDHRFLSPHPALSAQLGTPDPCIECHRDQDASWAQEAIVRWRADRGEEGIASGEPGSSPRQFAALFAEGASDSPDQHHLLRQLALDATQSAIVRASAVALLSEGGASLPDIEAQALHSDQDALVRTAATKLHRGESAESRLKKIAPLLRDPRGVVRIEAAKALLDIPLDRFPQPDREAMGDAFRELRGALLATIDYSETQMVVGGIALTLRDFSTAQRAFAKATRIDPQRIEGWLIQIRIALALGQVDRARKLITAASRANPQAPQIEGYRRYLME